MYKVFIKLLLVGLLISPFPLFPAFRALAELPADRNISEIHVPVDELKKEVFDILNTKCNTCHRKQNPFKVFSLKNMDKHAPKIHQQVFIKRRMPKGDKIKLTDQEYQSLQQWLQSQNIF